MITTMIQAMVFNQIEMALVMGDEKESSKDIVQGHLMETTFEEIQAEDDSDYMLHMCSQFVYT